MKKFLKIVIYTVLLLMLLGILGSFLAIRFIDPNQYKDKIASLVREETGRDFTIQGKLALSFFPWLGVRAEEVQLANAPGFTPAYFARAGEVNIRVKLIPLFSRQVEMGRVTLKKVDIHLAKNAQGVGNWQNILSEEKTTPSKMPSKTADKPLLFSIAGIDIENATLSFADAQKNKTWVLKNLYIKSDSPKINAFFPAHIAFDVESSSPKIIGHATLDSQVLFEKEKAHYTLQNPRFVFTPAEKNTAPLSLQAARLFVDTASQSASVEKGLMTAGDLRAQFSLEGKNIFDKFTLQGSLEIPAFHAKNVLNTFGKNITTADPNALQKVTLQTQFSGTPSSLQLKPFALGVDQSHIQGDVTIEDFAAPAIRFNLTLDQLVVDNYLSPPSNQTPTAVSPAQSTNSAPTGKTQTERVGIDPNSRPYQSNLSVKGNLRIGSLTFSHTVLNQVSTTLRLQNSLLSLTPLNASVYKGSMTGSVAIDFMPSTPNYTIDETLSDIDMAALVQSKRLTGKASLVTHLTTMGRDAAEIKRHLNGKIDFNIQNGALMGTNIPYQIERAIAVFKHRPAPTPPAATDRTAFDLLQGTGTFSSGLFTNSDLLIQSPQFRGTGQGSANLVTEVLHYQLRFIGLQSATDAQGKTVQEERRTPIPVLITGTFDKPILTPDLQVLIQDAVEEKTIQKVQEKLGPEAGRAVEGILDLLPK